MSAVVGTDIYASEVIETTEGWVLTIGWDSTTGTRRYVSDQRAATAESAAGTVEDPETTSLPSIGDAWSKELPTVTCRSIEARPLAGHPEVMEYVTSWSDSVEHPAMWSTPGNPWKYSVGAANWSGCPVSSGVAGIAESIASSTGWTWASDAAGVKQDLYVRSLQGSLTVQVMVSEDRLADCLEDFRAEIGHVNNDVTQGWPAESILFEGFDQALPVRNHAGILLYPVEWRFAIRIAVDGEGNFFGWNHLLRDATGEYDEPEKDGVGLYRMATLEYNLSAALQ